MHTCEYCGKSFEKPVTSGHKRKCPGFLAANPSTERKPPSCICGHESTSLTQMKRHRAKCDAWKSRDSDSVRNERTRNTFERRYGPGVTNSIHVPEFVAKKTRTMVERYGAENPFSKDASTYEKVQAHWEGKDRTAHLDKNNWARPEVKEKIKETMLARYGVTNPTLDPTIRAKQLATSFERYGDEQTLRVPSIRQKGIETWLSKYGVPDPMQHSETVEKVRLTNLDRYGVEWTSVHPETRQKQIDTQFSKYGTYYVGSEIGKQIISEKIPEIQEKYKNTCISKYGTTHPMKNHEYAKNHLEHSRRSGPNSLEIEFQSSFPQFMFTGDGSYWRFLPSIGRNKNPDFLLPGPHSESPFRGARAVVEIFGDYWHSEEKTGKSCVDHEVETIDAWSKVGFPCLVIWETEMKTNEAWKSRVSLFLNSL